MSIDYFIHEDHISSYTINAFTQAVVEATKQGYLIDYDSSRRIGSSFCVNFKVEDRSVETEEAPASEEAKNVPSEASEEPTGASEPKGDLGYEQPAGSSLECPTLAQIEDAKDSMKALNDLAEPFDITGKSKKELASKLREFVAE